MLARCDGLDSLADVSKEHLQLLKMMHAVGLKWAEKFLLENASLVFRLGYHSVYDDCFLFFFFLSSCFPGYEHSFSSLKCDYLSGPEFGAGCSNLVVEVNLFPGLHMLLDP